MTQDTLLPNVQLKKKPMASVVELFVITAETMYHPHAVAFGRWLKSLRDKDAIAPPYVILVAADAIQLQAAKYTFPCDSEFFTLIPMETMKHIYRRFPLHQPHQTLLITTDEEFKILEKTIVGLHTIHPDQFFDLPTRIEPIPQTAVITSPPFQASISRDTVNAGHRRQLARASGESNAEFISPIDMEKENGRQGGYGHTEGQLGAMRGGDTPVPTAVALPEPIEWHNCYDGTLKRIINPESFTHPAKMAPGLMIQILQYGERRYGWTKGQTTILDPFNGQGTTQLIGCRVGYDVIGVELEQYFYDLTVGCDCTGISKAEWMRFYGRFRRANYQDGRHWCPKCILDAERNVASKRPLHSPNYKRRLSALCSKTGKSLKQLSKKMKAVCGRKPTFPAPLPLSGTKHTTRSTRPLSLFAQAKAQYEQNNGTIPYTNAHAYHGNIAKMQAESADYGRPTTIRGDSRYLASLLAEFQAAVTSPPYSNSMNVARYPSKRTNGINPSQLAPQNAHYGKNSQVAASRTTYGCSDGQLGNMPTGTPPSAAITSPPYGDSVKSGEGTGVRHDYDSHSPETAEKATSQSNYGQTNGQLGNMPIGPSPTDAITSPPFSPPETRDNYQPQEGSVSDFMTRAYTVNRQGQTPGNLAAMPHDGDAPETYWGAVEQIYRQVYQLLPTGGVFSVVVKEFVKKGKIVDLPTQTARLLQNIGFTIDTIVHASLVKETTKIAFSGVEVIERKERKSFFRRLAEKNGSPRIDYEVVIFAVKGGLS